VPDDAPFLLDVTRLIWRRWRGRYPTGIDRVALAYLRHFRSRAQAVVQHDRFRRILDIKASQELFGLLAQPAKGFRPSLIFGAARSLRHLSGKGGGRPYLNVGHTGLDSPGFMRWIRTADVRPIYLVHDLIPITHPQFCRAGEDERHRRRMRTILQTAAGVIGNSQRTLDELGRFAVAERLNMPAAIPAWLGWDPLQRVQSGQPAKPTFVTLGTIEARKNHMMLLNVWSRLIHRLGADAPRLLVIGQRGWEAEAVFELLDRSDTLRGHVIELNHCSDEDLARHLGAARALLFPSHVEGYGLPVLEALGSGTPVLASDLPIFREVAGNGPDYLSADDEAGWERAILDYAATDSRRRGAQRERIRGFRPPDWTTHFNKVEQWLSGLS
jgi:glycosyltransferase involved in cell wall biosynthesis